MKRLKITVIILTLFLLTVTFSGCDYSYLFGAHYPSENLVVYKMDFCTDYEYANAFTVRYSFDGDENVFLETESNRVLNLMHGIFEKHGWKDRILIVVMEGIYYIIDAAEYDFPISDENADKLTIKVCSLEEFEKLYPDYKTEFKWYDRPINRREGYETD